jgi:aryl-alcohol dehydrogenase-like predicted oxidoreductase
MLERRAIAPDVEVPCVGMGTWGTFDVRGDAEERIRAQIVDEALRAGVRVFDTSPMYGHAERLLGRLVRPRRGEVFVATKIWARTVDEGLHQADRAIGWFGHVDLYQVHNLVSWPDHLALLEELRSQGVVRLIGATHYSPSAFPELASLMRSGRVDAIQVPYNPRERDVEREILPLAEELGIGVLVMRPFGGGALVRRSPDVSRLRSLGVRSWAEALLKWTLSDRRCTCAIPATSKPGRMTENARAGSPPWFDQDQRDYVARLAS